MSAIERFVLGNDDLELALLSRGARVQSLVVRSGQGPVNVVLGHREPAAYETDPSFLGAVVGRFANRIAHGRFVLDGVTHDVPVDASGHALHGGPEGFHRQLWAGAQFAHEAASGVVFTHTSPDGFMGFPGTLDARVTYTITGPEVRVDLQAVTDRPTVVNLTQHAYFNLAGVGSDGGEGTGSVESHLLQVRASHYLPTDPGSIPLGYAAPVAGSPFDFRKAKPVGAQLHDDVEQLRQAGGYDHSLVLDDPSLDVVAARLLDPSSGRSLEVRTDAPVVHLYSGNHLPHPRQGLCLEAQRPPDAPNQPRFASTVLLPGQEFRSSTIWHFGG